MHYYCNNYGHKVVDCRAYAWNINTWIRNRYENFRYQFEGNYFRKPHETFDRNYNRFGALNYEIECYKCNKFGHTTINYRSGFTSSSSPSKETRQVPEQQSFWKKKQEDLQIEECGNALQALNKRSHWYIDSGSSKHMTGDRNTLLSLKKEREGIVTFGNENSTKIMGKGTVSLGSKDALAKSVLLIENMNHNLLSVIQMCD